MAVYTLNDFLPEGKKVLKILSGTELYFVCELNKYMKLLSGDTVAVGVPLGSGVQFTEQFSYCVLSGLDVGVEVDRTKLRDYSKNVVLFFSDSVARVCISEKTDSYWLFKDDAAPENSVTRKASRSMARISIMAYMFVERKLAGLEPCKVVFDNMDRDEFKLENLDLRIMQDYGNRLFKDLVEIRVNSRDGKQQPYWETFLTYMRQRNVMCQEYTRSEKWNELKRKYVVGDVVLLYVRKITSKTDDIGTVEACYPAVIEKISEREIKLAYYPSVDTRLTRHWVLKGAQREYNMQDNISGGYFEFGHEDYERFVQSFLSLNLSDIGIANCTYKEMYFIMDLLPSDGTTQYAVVDGVVKPVWLPTIDTVYAVFEDRGVKYSRERFIDKYFMKRGKKPKYDPVTMSPAAIPFS